MTRRLLSLILALAFATGGTASAQTLTRIDINPGSERSAPFGFTRLGDAVYFVANDGTSGSELWRTDGTAAGTRRVKDIVPGPNGSFFDGLTEFSGALYFGVNDGTNGEELWRTDGTEAGTVLVKDINPGAASSNPEAFTLFDGALYFRASDGTTGDGTGSELWRTDGTTAGTVRVKDINPGTMSSFPDDFTLFDGSLYFSAITAAEGAELWRTDGTEAGTELVTEVDPTPSDRDGPRDLVVYDGALYFSAHDGVTGRELWRSDGTVDGTSLVKEFRTGGGDGGAGLAFLRAVELDGLLYLSANSRPEGQELWRTDGTTDGTVLLKDINSGTGDGYFIEGFGTSEVDPVVYQGRFFFSASDGASGAELWESDGTADGTVRVKDINPGAGDSAPYGLTPFATMIYFVADDGTTGYELWRTDGTTDGTVLVSDINPGAGPSRPAGFTVLGDALIFYADDGSTGREVWVLTDAPVPVEDGPAAPPIALGVSPNPASGSLTLSVALAAPAGGAEVSVYDALGRRVALVHDGPLAAGTHRMALDAARWPTGVYVARLATEAGVVVQRLTVVR